MKAELTIRKVIAIALVTQLKTGLRLRQRAIQKYLSDTDLNAFETVEAEARA